MRPLLQSVPSFKKIIFFFELFCLNPESVLPNLRKFLHFILWILKFFRKTCTIRFCVVFTRGNWLFSSEDLQKLESIRNGSWPILFAMSVIRFTCMHCKIEHWHRTKKKMPLVLLIHKIQKAYKLSVCFACSYRNYTNFNCLLEHNADNTYTIHKQISILHVNMCTAAYRFRLHIDNTTVNH